MIWALSASIGFVRRSVSSSTIVLGDSIAPDESHPVVSDWVKSCQDVSLATMGFSHV